MPSKAKPKPPPQPQRRPASRRLAYVCYKCEPLPLRVFVTDFDAPPPRCSTHGHMDIQENHPYRGKAV